MTCLGIWRQLPIDVANVLRVVTPRASILGGLACIIGAASCDSPTAPWVKRPLLQTTADSYRLANVGDGYQAEIDYQFENLTGGPVFLSNCKGSFFLHLERLEGAQWVGAWLPVVPLCASEPIVIGKGSVWPASLNVTASPFGSNAYPQFDRAVPYGTYRIVWSGASSSGSQLPLEARVSNSFQLSKP